MRIHIIVHESFEGPGAIEKWAMHHKHEVTYAKVYQGDSLPNDTNHFDFLIVMGGPQSPDTTLAECPYYDAPAEMALIKKAAEDGKFVLGVCLGAQLIGNAFGAAFEHSPHTEIGVFEINLTAAAKKDPIFSTFPDAFLAGHWHGDMPGLPETAVLLAYSAGCPRQIVKYTDKVYGFQCHLEFTKESIASLVNSCETDLQRSQGLPYVQSAEALQQWDYQMMNNFLFKFLDSLVSI